MTVQLSVETESGRQRSGKVIPKVAAAHHMGCLSGKRFADLPALGLITRWSKERPRIWIALDKEVSTVMATHEKGDEGSKRAGKPAIHEIKTRHDITVLRARDTWGSEMGTQNINNWCIDILPQVPSRPWQRRLIR